MDFQQIPLIVLAGPTGVGKTELSIHLAKAFDGEIINGDSLQVYRQLNIGTGKITPEEMKGIPHHLLNILEPDEEYNANLFKENAKQVVLDIYQRGKLPILVGGTGLYLEGLLYDLEFGQAEDETVRQRLEKEAAELGDLALWEKLQAIDPNASEKIPYQNIRRTIRALEVIEVSGELFSNQVSHQAKHSVFNELLFVLDRPRDLLYERINARVLMMIEAGLEEEVHRLYLAAQGANWQSLLGIGYKEWFAYFDGEITKDAVIAAIQQNSRRYAKRQLTWFRNRMKNPVWLDMQQEQAIMAAQQIVAEHIKKGVIRDDRNGNQP